jgi:hypothetical protein
MKIAAIALAISTVLLPNYALASSSHWIKEVSDEGGIVILEDDSIWGVESIDKIDSSLWLAIDDVAVIKNDDEPGYPYLLINTSEHETVHAKYLGRR